MAEIEKCYLEERAEAELSLAQAAAHPAAVRAHYLLAGLYLDRLYDEGCESPPHSSNDGHMPGAESGGG